MFDPADAEEDRGGATYFDEDIDPLALVEGLEHTDVDAFQVLRRQRRRRRSKRIAKLAGAEYMDEGEEDSDGAGFTTDEGGFTEEEEGDMGEGLSEEEEVERRHNVMTNTHMSRGKERSTGSARIPTKDGSMMTAGQEAPMAVDKWDSALADMFGMNPPSASRKSRSRDARRRSRRGVKRRQDLPLEAAQKLGEANLLYAQRRHSEAISLLREVIRLAPYSPDAYNTLGVLYEEVGDHKRSLDFSMIAAHLTPKDVSLWRRLADLSARSGYIRQTIYCLTQVIRRDRDDIDAKYERALLLAELGENRKALDGLEAVRSARPTDPEVVKHLARLYYRTGQYEKGAECLRDFISRYPDATDLTHINLLAELLSSPEMEAWEEVITLIDTTERELLIEDEELPVELVAKKGIAIAHKKGPDDGAEILEPILSNPVDVFSDVFLNVVDSFESLSRDDLALPYLRALSDDAATAGPLLWQKLADNRLRAEGRMGAANVWKQYVERITPDSPWYADVVVRLADALRHAGDQKGASNALLLLDRAGRHQMDEEGSQDDHDGSLPSDMFAGKALGLGGLIWTGEMTSMEEEILHKADLLKSCGRLDLIADLTLPALRQTLDAFAVGVGVDSNRKGSSLERKMKEPNAAWGASLGLVQLPEHADLANTVVQEDSEAMFVGYVSRRRRQRPSQRKKDGSEQDVEMPAAQDMASTDYGEGATGAMSENPAMDPMALSKRDSAGVAADENVTTYYSSQRQGEESAPEPMIQSLLKDERPFQLLIDATLGLLSKGCCIEAKELAQLAVDVLAKRSPNRRKRDTMRLLLCCACLEGAEKDVSAAMNAFKSPATRWPSSPFLWNVFSRLLLAAEGPRQTIKFLIHFRVKNPDSVPLLLALGHVHMVSRQYGAALGEYLRAYYQAPQEPLVLFSIAACLINIATSRFAPDRHANVIQAFAFLQEYSRYREDTGEALYNFGRACQQLSLQQMAVVMYDRVLKTLSMSLKRQRMSSGASKDKAATKQDDGQPSLPLGSRDMPSNSSDNRTVKHDTDDDMNLSMEASFNLSLIYKESGAEDLARAVVRRYLVF